MNRYCGRNPLHTLKQVLLPGILKTGSQKTKGDNYERDKGNDPPRNV